MAINQIIKSYKTSTPVRIVNVSETEAFAIATHAKVGAVALHLVVGNKGDSNTPQDSLGGEFGQWRIYGLRILPSIASNPVTEYTKIIYAGIGSQEYAINIENEYGGIYHGLSTDAPYTQTGTSLSSNVSVSSVSLTHDVTIEWVGGQTADVLETITFDKSGSVRTDCTVNCDFNTLTASLAMLMVGMDFTRLSTDGGSTWSTISTGDTTTNVDEVQFRDPYTGLVVITSDDAREANNFNQKFVNRSGDRNKIYSRFDTPANGNLGHVSCTRLIDFDLVPYDKEIPISTNYDNGEFSGYLSPWGANSDFTAGVDYNATLSVNESIFPEITQIETDFPDVSHPSVWGYFFIAKGDYRNSPGSEHPEAVAIENLEHFTESFEWSYEGSENFNLLSEHWLTSAPNDFDTIVYEIGFFLHYETTATHWYLHNHGDEIGDYDDGSNEWHVRWHNGFCTFALDDTDLLSGTIDRKAAIAWLLEQSALSPEADWALNPEWYLNGTAFGVEPTDGGGTTAVDIVNWNAIWSASPLWEPFTDTFSANTAGDSRTPAGWIKTHPASGTPCFANVVDGEWTVNSKPSQANRWIREGGIPPGDYTLDLDYRTANGSAGTIQVDNSNTGAGSPYATLTLNNSSSNTTLSLDFTVPPGEEGFIRFSGSQASPENSRSSTIIELSVNFR